MNQFKHLRAFLTSQRLPASAIADAVMAARLDIEGTRPPPPRATSAALPDLPQPQHHEPVRADPEAAALWDEILGRYN